MEKTNTKRKILTVALDLFSVNGYEATSMSQIAEAVGIQKATVYSHYESKQKILDNLLADISEEYEKHSVFSRFTENDFFPKNNCGEAMSDTVVRMVLAHVDYIIHDEIISKVRKFLTIEQFRNPQIAALQTKRNYDDVMNFFTKYVRYGIDCGKIKGGDAEVVAAQLCLPISVWINLCDREPTRENEVKRLIERHIRTFFETYGR